jgi:SAM-dependent methyltransferase
MNDWTQGYVSDIEYLPGFYAEQVPAHLDAICLLKGIEPPVDTAGAFTYCELGCGVGETALAIAAANPESQVWGFDFNPAHIARGRALAQSGGVANIRLEEASFEELAKGEFSGLPQYDYITMHGVWSWISPENRDHIIRFIDGHLKPGGLVYVTYNALPGWASAVPLQRLLSMLASLSHDRSDRRIVGAIDAVLKISEAGAAVLPKEMLAHLEKERDGSRHAYLSHEYLNEHWAPCFHADVAGEMARAKLSYVGTATMLENFPDLSLTAKQREIIAGLPANLAETMRDYFTARAFRRDVFIRGARPIPERRLDQRIGEIRLGLVVPASAVTRDIQIPLGEATLNEGFYKPAFEALAKAPHTIAELRSLPGAESSTASPREILGMLIGSRQAMVTVREPDESGRRAARAYNAAHLAACAEDGRAICALAAGALGSAVTVRLFEMLVYEVLAPGNVTPKIEPVTAAIWELLQQRGDKVRHEGQIIEDPDENIRAIRENVGRVLDIALPFWQRIGAI